jgi:hypothetical protein
LAYSQPKTPNSTPERGVRWARNTVQPITIAEATDDESSASDRSDTTPRPAGTTPFGADAPLSGRATEDENDWIVVEEDDARPTLDSLSPRRDRTRRDRVDPGAPSRSAVAP